MNKKRMEECENRRPGSCSLIDIELGWVHGINESDCDRCWESNRDPKVRQEVVLRVRGQMLDPKSGMLEKASLNVLTALTIKGGADPDLVSDVVSRRWGLEKAEEFCKNHGCKNPPRKYELQKLSGGWELVKETWGQAASFLKSQASAIGDKRVSLEVKNQRMISCTGMNLKGELVDSPCQALGVGKYGPYCNDCGCGDRHLARILEDEGYSKLDYPYLECPRGRSGFSNEKLKGRVLESSFEKVFLVNLDRRKDRLETCMKEFDERWPFKKPIRWRAVDGSLCPSPYGWSAGGGAWGCMQSHRQILEHCLLEGINSVMVLEDDAYLLPEFEKQIQVFMDEVPSDWECLMIGGQHIRDPVPVSKNVVRCKDTQRTHAYVLRGSLIKDLYREWSSRSGHCDHSMGPFCGSRITYAPSKFLIGQGEGQSDISGRIDRFRTWDRPEDKAPIYVLESASVEQIKELRTKFHFGYTTSETGVDAGLNSIFQNRGYDETKFNNDWLPMLRWEAEAVRKNLVVWHPDAFRWIPEMKAKHGDIIQKVSVQDLLNKGPSE